MEQQRIRKNGIQTSSSGNNITGYIISTRISTPNAVKENKSIDFLFEKGLSIDNRLQIKPHEQANINMSSLLDWEKAISNTISTVKMQYLFTASVNKEFMETIQFLKNMMVLYVINYNN